MKLDKDNFIRARERLGYAIETVAEEAGVSKNSVLRAEHGEDIRPLTARKIAAALGVAVADLYEEAEYPKEAAPQPSLEAAALDEVLREALAALFRNLARRAHLIAQRSRQEGPSAELTQELKILHEDAARLYRIRRQWNIWGKDSEELEEAEDAYQEAEEVIQRMLRQDLGAPDEERREARRFRLETGSRRKADAS